MKSGGGKHKATLSDVRNIKNFYPTCIDNFFDDPNLIRELGLKLPKYKDKDGYWPGERTKMIHEIDNELNSAIIFKIFSIYFDLTFHNVSWGSSCLSFQKIKPFHKNKDHIFNKSWIHKDEDYQLAGLIYLNPNPDLDSGTSLFKVKDNEDDDVGFQRYYERHRLHLKEKNLDEEIYKKQMDLHNNKFVETIRFQNQYNRLITYDANYFHMANNYHSGNDRLTLVFFIDDITVEKYPMERVKKFGNESYINDVAKKLITK